MVKKLFWTAALAAAVFGAWRFGYPEALRYFFKASGTVELGGAASQALPAPNSMLFVVASNDGGVPVAVKKIINPVFPVEFEINSSNLIMPDLLTSRIYLEAMLNTHGNLGVFRTGDLRGKCPGRVYIFTKGLSIKLEK